MSDTCVGVYVCMCGVCFAYVFDVMCGYRGLWPGETNPHVVMEVRRHVREAESGIQASILRLAMSLMQMSLRYLPWCMGCGGLGF